MSCGKCAGSQVGKTFLGSIGEIVFCSQNRDLAYKAVQVVGATITGIGAYLFAGNKKNTQVEENMSEHNPSTSIKLNGIDCLPFTISLEEAKNQDDMNIVTSQPVMEGGYGNDIMIADEKGSKMFASGGHNIMIASPAKDEFSFSLCDIKIEDKTSDVIIIDNIIIDFDPEQDTIGIHCMEHHLDPSNFEILHDSINGTDMTYIYIHVVDKAVHEEDDDAFIALVGNFPDLNPSDLVLNEPWEFCSA
jgi:hypothetical protein